MKAEGLFQRKIDCNGCGACASFCSQKAITMNLDEEGFYYPIINEDRCIDCNLCEKMCPQKNRLSPKEHLMRAFGFKNNDNSVLKESTSGGAFSALCRVFYELHPGGIVYGCVMTVDENHVFRAKHIRATSLEECKQFRGSKYLQSEFWPVISEIEDDLKEYRHVMCVGTPCQIAGVSQRFSMKYEKQLLLVDVLCHSAPSPLMFNEHIKSLEFNSQTIVSKYCFRPKTKGWRHYEEAYDLNGSIIMKNRRQTQRHKELFYAELISRPSCSQCQYAGLNSVSDLTMGDFWGVESVLPEFYDKKGVSLVIIHSEKARQLLSSNQLNCTIAEVNPEQAIKHNHSKPRPQNINRESFWRTYRANGYEFAAKRFLEPDLIWAIKRIIRVFFPDQIRERLKKLLYVK